MGGEDGVYRKRRNGREYGSFHVYAGGRIVNLKTTLIDDAREKARALMGGAASEKTSVPLGTTGAAPLASSSPPRFSWAGVGHAMANGAPAPAPAAAGPPPLSAAMEGLADGLAAAVTQLNAVTAALAVKHLGGYEPAKVDPDNLAALEKTWALGLREMIALSGMRWWHVLLIQNATLVTTMVRDGKKLPPKALATVEAAPAAS